MTTPASSIQEVLELIEKLPADDQNLVIEIVRNRLAAKQREVLLSEIAEARAEYKAGNVHRGAVEALLSELDE